MKATSCVAFSMLLAFTGTAKADDQQPFQVVENAFCINKTGLDCIEFRGSADGDTVAISQLPRLDGKPVLYFHSAQTMPPGATVTHFWQSEDSGAYRPKANYYVSDAAQQATSGVLDAFLRSVEQLKAGSLAVLFRNPEPASVKAYRTWSCRDVYGPGQHTTYTAKVDGTRLPGSHEQSITVVH